ncbi:MAG: enoyl-CoA hydratase [Myxococcaceae bacterium]|jgi:hypothetical protein|nr:enoyl-CoA hydratase [Myxococcaceae bacterium]MEA2747413.1 hypothetical protein [Myxococcales bacterium]
MGIPTAVREHVESWIGARPWVTELATRIAGFPSVGLRNVKRFVNASFLPKESTLADEAAAFRTTMAHPEFAERLTSLFARGAQTAVDLELKLGEAIARFERP